MIELGLGKKRQIQVYKKNMIELGYYTRNKIHLLRLTLRYINQLHVYLTDEKVIIFSEKHLFLFENSKIRNFSKFLIKQVLKGPNFNCSYI